MKNNIPGTYRTFRGAWTILHFIVVAAAVAALVTWALENNNAVRIFQSSGTEVLEVQQRVSNVIPWPWGVDDDGGGSSSGSTSESDDGSYSETAAEYQVIGNLNVRSGPGVEWEVVTTLSDGEWITIDCTTTGTTVDPEPYQTQVSDWAGVDNGPTSLWDHIPGLGYVSDAYVATGSNGAVAPECPN